MGGACARVCPTEVLCERPACATAQEDKPVQIGALQRYATDSLFAREASSPSRARRRAASASRWSAPGRPASPARIALAMLGHAVTVFEAKREARRAQRIRYRRLQGGRTTSRSARSSSSCRSGGIEAQCGKALGRDVDAGAAASRFRRGVPGHGAGRRQRAAGSRARAGRRGRTRSPISRGCARRRTRRAAGRRRSRRDRRRQHRHRHRRAEPSAWAPRT